MYIIRNALKCIRRSKGRNILIGIIALVIAVSACIGLSIRQAAESAKAHTLEGMNITATISYDRQSMMNNMKNEDNMTPPNEGSEMQGGGKSGFDRNSFAEKMGEVSSLTLDEYLKYSEASSVKDFYYSLTSYFNASDKFEPITTETEDDTSTENEAGFPSGSMMGGRNPGSVMGGMTDGDFTVIGYSSDTAMTDFLSGNTSVTEGEVFAAGTSDYNCIISDELATYNSLSAGDTIVISNPNSEAETYTLAVVGIYTSSSSNDFSMSMFGSSQDPANKIYMSATALQSILDASEAASATVTDEDTGREYKTALTGNLSATYVFADVDSYYLFEDEVRTLGLDDSYTVSSTDISAFENSLTPLNTLSRMAGWFLIVILGIGAVIIIVLNIFNVRERKYEIGVLTAMGMKKGKVALQFICEILVVTMIAVIIGAAIGAISAVPVTNALLENQVESKNEQQTQIENNFGRPGDMGGEIPEMGGNTQGRGENKAEGMLGGAVNYITEIDSAMNLTVVLQMLGIGLLLTLAASAVSVLFVMRYDPLKILANRD